MHCSLRYKSHQSRECFVMHLSSALQIGPILSAFCHALQLALQITPNPESTLSCTAACVTNHTKSREHFVMHCSLRYKSHQIPRALCHLLQLALQIRPISTALCHVP